MQQWLARAFARQTGARSAVKRLKSAQGRHNIILVFARSLADSHPPVETPHDLTPAHMQAFRERYANRRVQHDYVKRLRTLLRDDPDLPEPARAALLDVRLPPRHEPDRLVAYSDHEWQAIMTAIRHDIRVARDRIYDGRAVLDRFRAGTVDDRDTEVGRWLDLLDRTGDLPRVPSGDHIGRVRRAGGLRQLGLRLCLSQQEATAFCLLLTALTAENFGTVVTWPAVHSRPDGTHGQTGIALVEETKPRRGPEREHMIAALEDLPPALADILDDTDAERRLFRSPLRVYRLLVDLTELTRRRGGHTEAVTAFISHPGRFGQSWSAGANAADVVAWARSHGFPAAKVASPDGKPAVHVGRIRQTVLEHRRHPVAHTRQTMNDVYLKRSRTVQVDSRAVVAAALRDQVGKARARQGIAVLTADFLARARNDLASAAAEAGLEPTTLQSLIAREQDTAVASCVDHRSSPHSEPGEPCTASFLACLSCQNARALPHQLPVQTAVRDRISALRPNLAPELWRARYEPVLDSLDDILGHYTPAERDRARRELSVDQQSLVDDLMNGRLDLR